MLSGGKVLSTTHCRRSSSKARRIGFSGYRIGSEDAVAIGRPTRLNPPPPRRGLCPRHSTDAHLPGAAGPLRLWFPRIQAMLEAIELAGTQQLHDLGTRSTRRAAIHLSAIRIVSYRIGRMRPPVHSIRAQLVQHACAARYTEAHVYRCLPRRDDRHHAIENDATIFILVESQVDEGTQHVPGTVRRRLRSQRECCHEQDC